MSEKINITEMIKNGRCGDKTADLISWAFFEMIGTLEGDTWHKMIREKEKECKDEDKSSPLK